MFLPDKHARFAEARHRMANNHLWCKSKTLRARNRFLEPAFGEQIRWSAHSVESGNLPPCQSRLLRVARREQLRLCNPRQWCRPGCPGKYRSRWTTTRVVADCESDS